MPKVKVVCQISYIREIELELEIPGTDQARDEIVSKIKGTPDDKIFNAWSESISPQEFYDQCEWSMTNFSVYPVGEDGKVDDDTDPIDEWDY